MIIDPVDPTQCQALLPSRHSAFSLGPPPKERQRCTNRPTYIVNEIEKGKDGEYGAMSLCVDCKNVFITQMMNSLHKYVFSEIVPYK